MHVNPPQNFRHVRLEAALCMQHVANILHKSLAPHLRALLPHWLLSCNDPYRPTATAAHTALTTLLPRPEKQTAAVVMARTEVGGCSA